MEPSAVPPCTQSQSPVCTWLLAALMASAPVLFAPVRLSFLFLKLATHLPTSGPFYWLFPPCPSSLPDIHITGLFTLFRPLIKCHLLREAPPPLSLSSLSLCFSSPYSTFYLTHYIYFKTRCLVLLSSWKLHVSFVLFPAVSSLPTIALGTYLLNK